MSERFFSNRPIQATGWAFFLLIIMLGMMAGPPITQHANALRETSHAHAASSQWEGSPAGVQYSDRNHHLAGIFILLVGLTELWGALGIGLLAWSRFLLPMALCGAGVHLLIWSDHDAWPIGSLSFTQTLFGGDWEILQHKTYAVLLLSIGTIEWLRWSGRLRHVLWAVPFPTFAVIGGLMLFLHSHGVHPSAHKIALDHAIMGTMAVSAGFCKLVSERTVAKTAADNSLRWDMAWAGFIVLIGLQLLFYTE